MWRMRIPEAFRCQDMTHHDVIAMARLVVAAYPNQAQHPVFVVGPRTAGSYFVPLVRAVFERHGLNVMGAIAIRPKEGLSTTERRQLRAANAADALIVIVDDHPNTGNTFVLMVSILRGLGAANQNMVIVAPDHAAQTDWTPRVHPVRVITLAAEQFYKAKLLADDARLLDLVLECTGMASRKSLRVFQGPALDRINDGLRAHYPDSFQVRLKRVFGVDAPAADSGSRSSLILAKSVGWGWLGYHAPLAADRLQEFVPRLIGLRSGLMFIEWVGNADWPHDIPSRECIAERVPGYVASREHLLPLAEDPTVGVIGYRTTARDKILRLLRRPYGSMLQRVAREALNRRHDRFVAPNPTLVDGRITPENWVGDAAGPRKVDFEHHNFGGGEEDIVDPLFDIAGAIYSLNLDDEEENRLLGKYLELSGVEPGGAAGIGERLMLYKLFVGQRAMGRSADVLDAPGSPERHRQANLNFLAARNFLTYQMNRHHAARIDVQKDLSWSQRLFFMDLDGVFDVQLLGFFPHTTANGLKALRLLQTQGYSVVPNTDRSVEHVRNYCETYGLPGGIAEHGSIFVDRVAGREQLLLGKEAQQELGRCRSLLEKMPGVHLDPGYQEVVHCYRYRGSRWIGLAQNELQALLSEGGFKWLDVIAGSADTYFVPKGISKGSALEAAVQRIGVSSVLTVAIGDSIRDMPMLARADRGFVVANGSADLKAFARSAKHVRLLRQPVQRGLLEAVQHTLDEHDGTAASKASQRAQTFVRASDQSLDEALAAFERPVLGRWLSVLFGARRNHPRTG